MDIKTTIMDYITSGRLLVLVCAITAYYLGLAAYRLYFSPLAKIPGPKLAALTLWYEFYYDVIKRGKYTWRIAEMHTQYGERGLGNEVTTSSKLTNIEGPIVRISPYELHIDDPEYATSHLPNFLNQNHIIDTTMNCTSAPPAEPSNTTGPCAASASPFQHSAPSPTSAIASAAQP